MLRTALLLLAASLAANAQPGRGAPVRSPEVAPDGKVTLRLRAPNAKEVAVAGLGERLVLQKDEQGIWSGTTAPLKPEMYTYTFQVDGMNVSDPANPSMKTSWGSGGQSMVRVPGNPLLDPGTGPRGSVTRHFYHSALIGDDRDYYVYTPPNYDRSRKEPYPVLFLLHGLGDDAYGWLSVGAANVILDNLINQGKARPMIMVNTLGYGTPEGARGAMAPEMIPAFARALLEEVSPQVEKNYNAAKDRSQRAIAGLSMGGAESLFTGLNHIDRFAYVASFSGAFVMWPKANPAPPAATPPGGGGGGGRGGRPTVTVADIEKNFPDLDAKAASQLKLLWIGCGTEDGLIGVNHQFQQWLKSKNITHTAVDIPEYAHVWPLWRINLAEIAPMLFQK